MQKKDIFCVSRVLDASVKLPDGIVDGSVNHLGHFDQCLDVSVDDLQGQYCLVEISFQPVSYIPTQTVDPYTLQFDSRIHVWEKLKKSKDRSKFTRSTLRLGLCMPSSCTPQQLQMTLSHELQLLGQREGLIFKSQVSPQLCATHQEPMPWSTGEIVFSFLVGLLILLVVISSCYSCLDFNRSYISAAEQVILCFSIQRSMKGLMSVSKQHPGLNCMDVYKFVLILCVIFGHRILIISDSLPISDANQHENLFRSMGKSIIVNGELVVDFFFVASGTLIAYHLLSHLEKHKSANLLIVIVGRIFRLTPTYIVVVFFHATVFHRLGSGPLWESVVGRERDRCQANWWTNLLYINNYFNADTMCMLHSWYLSVDTQLFIVSLLVVYVISKWPSWGYSILAIMSSLSLLVPFIKTWLRQEDPLFLVYKEAMGDIPGAKYFHEMYIRTENRGTPYFIGIIIGLILVKLKESKFRLRMVPSLVCFAALKVVFIGSIMASYPFYRPGTSATSMHAALYASLSRLFFGASCGGISLLARFGNPGFLISIAEWKPFRVLSRLVYGVYLVHMLGQMYHVGSLRTHLQTGVYPCLWMLMGDVMFSFALSFLLMVLTESPVRALEKLVFQRDLTKHVNHQKSS
ncbi:nose resistant to fluoxetine protein 6-like isoform X2 [Bacillus rossius redtenbacheri]|uniref:nose resistant to fluoxetine protein 6-like isoform X2 n=1 Tax=Bacillus rossius redtenbacheri TaxID=93214 RepID=UPI002FDDB159